MDLLKNIYMTVIRFRVPLLYPILPLLVPPFCVCLVNLPLIHLSQSSLVDPHSFVSATDKYALFNVFLKWTEDRKLSNSTTSIAHTSTSFTGLTQSSSIGPWVFESRATDRITSNKSLFSSLSSPDNLPSVTMANGSRVLAHGVGTVNLFIFFIH